MRHKNDEILYRHDPSVHNLNAPRQVVPLIVQLLSPESVLDVGCGTGAWLKAFEEAGVSDVLGIDGSYLDKELLVIDQRKFQTRDLRQEWDLGRVFDLVICLEVAEHLPPHSADLLVRQLCRHGKNIVFSAAIPGQIGQNHINEQWPQYWKKKFEDHGYYYHDIIRPLIWNNNNVDLWYKQNTFLFTRENNCTYPYLAIVHPEMVELLYKTHKEYLESLIGGRQGLVISTRIFLNAIGYKLRDLFRNK